MRCLNLTVLAALHLALAPWGAMALDEPTSDMARVLVVDAMDQPVENARVRNLDHATLDSFSTTDAHGLCHVALTSGLHSHFGVPVLWRPMTIYATNATGSLQGILPTSQILPGTQDSTVTIKVTPCREVTVRVSGKEGDPIGGATVGITVDGGHELTAGQTNAKGSVQFRIPAEASVWSIFAFKSACGFQNWTTRATPESPQRTDLPTELALTLDGAESVRIRAADRTGRPVEGVVVYPTAVLRSSEPKAYHSFQSSNLADISTDSDGIATFDWLPRGADGLQLGIRARDYYLWNWPDMEKAFHQGQRELNAELIACVTVAGRLRDATGRPVGRVAVRAWGLDNVRIGQLMRVDQQSACSAPDGTYRLRLCPGFTYAVNIIDADWTTIVRAGVEIKDGVSVDDFDFELNPGTVLFGKVTSGDERQPYANQNLFVSQIVGDVKGIRNGACTTRWFSRIPAAEDEVKPPTTHLLLRYGLKTTTDADGRYRIRLGPGDYQLHATNPLAERPALATLQIGEEPEVERDLHVDPPGESPRGGRFKK
ncbi:MAG: hypothetical protein ACKV0T_06370 [Planctomycetales bacterium]